LKIVRDMPACVSGTTFDWPQVIFESAEEAGNAVALALQNATCTFTVAPSPTPAPTPTPTLVPVPGAVRNIGLTAGDGQIQLIWAPPTAIPAAIVDYRTRCRAGDGDWIESNEGVSLETRATVQGLSNGAEYRCEVAVVAASSEGAWTAATATATPVGRPAPPGKPSVVARDRALQVSVAPADIAVASRIYFECSGDNGANWRDQADVSSADSTTAQIGGLTNGLEYVCRAFVANTVGRSEASPLSDAIKPCGSILECNPVVLPILAVIGFLLVGGLLVALIALYRDRARGYVIAVVDVVHTANLGHGSKLGIGFVRPDGTRRVSSIVADRGPDAEIRIRPLRGGRFTVIDRTGRRVTSSGEPIVAVDSMGVRHELVLRAFATKAASEVSRSR